MTDEIFMMIQLLVSLFIYGKYYLLLYISLMLFMTLMNDDGFHERMSWKIEMRPLIKYLK
jgi:hypothetical protein